MSLNQPINDIFKQYSGTPLIRSLPSNDTLLIKPDFRWPEKVKYYMYLIFPLQRGHLYYKATFQHRKGILIRGEGARVQSQALRGGG